MKIMAMAAVSLCIPLVANAALYKCEKEGKTKYQDLPCASGTRSSAVQLHMPAPSASSQTATDGSTPPATAPAAPQTDLQRTQAWLDAAELERKKSRLDREISNAEVDRDNLQKQMDAEILNLKLKKFHASNNLAGATWEESISSEMQAITLQYDAKIRAAESHIVDLKAQREKLGN